MKARPAAELVKDVVALANIVGTWLVGLKQRTDRRTGRLVGDPPEGDLLSAVHLPLTRLSRTVRHGVASVVIRGGLGRP
jgi:hypothetical protein